MSDRPTDRPIDPDQLAVTLAVREDLGAGHDPVVISEFLDRVGDAIDSRVDARVETRSRRGPVETPLLAYVSLGVAVPVTAIALGTTGGGADGILALLVAWGGIVGVNLAHRRR